MYSLLLCLLVLPNLAERFQHRLLGRDGADVGGTNQQAVEVLAESPPNFDDVKKWARYFQSDLGGDYTNTEANKKAMKLLTSNANPPKLEDVKKWARYFQSDEGGDYTNTEANRKAMERLARKTNKAANQQPVKSNSKSPHLRDVKKWARYFQTDLGGDYTSAAANQKAKELLTRNANPPKLEDVKKWARYFQSDLGGDYTNTAANKKAMKLLTSNANPPKLEDVKKWARYFQSDEGGDYTNTEANRKAMERLARKTNKAANQHSVESYSKSPNLRDVKKWARYFQTDLGGDYTSAAANKKAKELLARNANPPKLEDVKKWARYFQSDEGGDYTNTEANRKAFEMLKVG